MQAGFTTKRSLDDTMRTTESGDLDRITPSHTLRTSDQFNGVTYLNSQLGWNDPNPEKDRKDKALHSGMCRYGNEPLSQWSSVQGSADPEWIAEEIGFVIPKV